MKDFIRRISRLSVVRYLGVGGTAFLVDFLTTVILHDLVHLALWIAVACGYWAGFLVNFSLQRSFAFKSGRGYAWSLVWYFCLVGFNWVATTVLMHLMVDTWNWSTAVGKIAVTALTVIWNYPAYRFLVFPEKRSRVVAVSVEHPSSVDFIIPAHNAASLLANAVETIGLWARAHESLAVTAYLVENGSTDDTWEVAEELAKRSWSPGFSVEAMQSDVGMGAAYRAGIRASGGDRLVLTADDLPFGMTDINAWWQCPVSGLAIGSKAHPESRVLRGRARSIASFGFRIFRLFLLGSKIGDPQGTLVVEGDWARSLEPLLREDGYLSSTEIVAFAEARGVPVTEMPVALAGDQGDHATRIRAKDVVRMGTGLIRLRIRVGSSGEY